MNNLNKVNVVIQPLTDAQISNVGSFDIDVKQHLEHFKNYQNNGMQVASPDLGLFIHTYEQNIYKYLGTLGGDQYSNGFWKMDHGFFLLDAPNDLYVLNGYQGSEYKLNSYTFSAVVNLIVLSQMACDAYTKQNFFKNQMSVFLSDHLKDLIDINSHIFDTKAIFDITD